MESSVGFSMDSPAAARVFGVASSSADSSQGEESPLVKHRDGYDPQFVRQAGVLRKARQNLD